MDTPAAHKIILFDGVCQLCNATVRFIQTREKKPGFQFLSLQSADGKALLKTHGYAEDQNDTLVLIEGKASYIRSTAVLKIAAHLTWPYKAAAIFILIPRALRDMVYKFVARNRHRSFFTDF